MAPSPSIWEVPAVLRAGLSTAQRAQLLDRVQILRKYHNPGDPGSVGAGGRYPD